MIAAIAVNVSMLVVEMILVVMSRIWAAGVPMRRQPSFLFWLSARGLKALAGGL